MYKKGDKVKTYKGRRATVTSKPRGYYIPIKYENGRREYINPTSISKC